MSTGSLPTHFEPADRADSERILEQSRHFLADPLMRSVVDSSKAFITVLNSHRQVIFANHAMTAAFGATLEEALGDRPGELVGCVQVASAPGGCGTSEACATCGAVLAIRDSRSGEPSERECRIELETGQQLDLQVTATPFAVDGESYTLFTAIDIGDTKRRRALERIFFHDIMNTATGVQGLSSLMATAPESERSELVDLLELASSHLIDEIQAQRELLAAENDELSVHSAPIRTSALLSELARLYKSHEVGVGKTVEVTDVGADLVCLSDPTLLGRVIGNLIKNALEATEVGGTVTLKCAHAGSRVEFSVHNESVIPHRDQLQIFQRSFTTKGDGHGLGTYGARLLTERYLNGSIRFTSDKGAGTTFTVSYPLVVPAAADLPFPVLR